MRRISFDSESGAILPIVIILMLALTITGIAFLSASVLEHSLAMREVYRNQAFFLADGGIERLKYKFKIGERASDWPEAGGYRVAVAETPSGEGHYWVDYYGDTPPYAISTGRITKNPQEIIKRIKIEVNESSVFDYAIFGDEWVHMQGNTVVGVEVGADPEDRATIGTNSTSEADPYAIEATGSPLIDAYVVVGPNGDLEAAINASEAVIPPEDRGALPDEIDLPEIELPDWADPAPPSYIPPIDLTVSGPLQASLIMPDTYVDSDGNISRIAHYGELSIMATGDELLIDEDCILVVETLDMNAGGPVGQPGGIVIEADNYLTLYVTQSASIAGNGIINMSGESSHLHIYGTDTCTGIDFNGTSDLEGAIYAPEAAITIGGNASIIGSVIGRTIYLQGTPEVRWDPDLSQGGGPTVLVLGNWEEIS